MVGFVPELRNTPKLDGTRLYAVARDDAANQKVIQAYPDRTPFRLTLTPRGWRLTRLTTGR